MPGPAGTSATAKYMADAIGSGVPCSAFMHPELLQCWPVCLINQLIDFAAHPVWCLCLKLLLFSGMTQPEEWLEELLGFCQDGTRKCSVPCPPYVPTTQGLPGLLFYGLYVALLQALLGEASLVVPAQTGPGDDPLDTRPALPEQQEAHEESPWLQKFIWWFTMCKALFK